jgi:hypothetical protein
MNSLFPAFWPLRTPPRNSLRWGEPLSFPPEMMACMTQTRELDQADQGSAGTAPHILQQVFGSLPLEPFRAQKRVFLLPLRGPFTLQRCALVLPVVSLLVAEAFRTILLCPTGKRTRSTITLTNSRAGKNPRRGMLTNLASTKISRGGLIPTSHS